MPASAALADDFNDNSLDVGKWTQTNAAGVTGSEASQTYRFTIDATAAAFSDLTSADSYDLTGSHHTVELADAGVQQEGLEAYLIVRADASNRLFIVIANGVYGVYKVVAGTQTGVSFGTYIPADHRWLRIREASGTMFWEHSPDGVSWSEIHSEPNPITVTAVQLMLQAGAWQQLGAAKTVVYDNVGGLSAQSATPTGVASTAALGTPALASTGSALPTGIPPSSAAGTLVSLSSGSMTPTGIVSTAALGAPQLIEKTKTTPRPDSGVTARPHSGAVAQPSGGTVARP